MLVVQELTTTLNPGGSVDGQKVIAARYRLPKVSASKPPVSQ
jgi:hypothetical protein